MDDIINAQNLTKTFGTFTAVNGVTFNVPKGEIFAFLGPNGAGKTTTIKMLTTLLKPTTGTIKLNGIDAITNPEKARKTFGIVFQDPSLDDELTAMENMEFHAVLYKVPKNELKERVKKFLNFVELWDRRNDLVKTFSGGMKRRLEIARGLLHKPDILFLDEPLASLDIRRENEFVRLIKETAEERNITVLLIAHNINPLLPVLNKVIYVANSRVLVGDASEVFTSEFLTKLYNSPVEVLRDSYGRIAIIGAQEGGHHHDHDQAKK